MLIFTFKDQKMIELTILTFKNVQRYKYDVEELIETNSYSHAIALAILGIEEWAKGIIFLQILLGSLTDDVFRNLEPKLSFDDFIKNHIKKIEYAKCYVYSLFYQVWYNARIKDIPENFHQDIEELSPHEIQTRYLELMEYIVQDESNEGKILLALIQLNNDPNFTGKRLNLVKQDCFYVDYKGRKFSISNEQDVKPYRDWLELITLMCESFIIELKRAKKKPSILQRMRKDAKEAEKLHDALTEKIYRKFNSN